eukprot:357881-Chlamydomonas_euryale.AAC.11
MWNQVQWQMPCCWSTLRCARLEGLRRAAYACASHCHSQHVAQAGCVCPCPTPPYCPCHTSPVRGSGVCDAVKHLDSRRHRKSTQSGGRKTGGEIACTTVLKVRLSGWVPVDRARCASTRATSLEGPRRVLAFLWHDSAGRTSRPSHMCRHGGPAPVWCSHAHV